MESIAPLYSLFQAHPFISTDTRSILPDSIFFALKGDRFNGNLFAAEALGKGAAFAVVDEGEYALNDRYILVNNVLATLQELARHHRRMLNPLVIALTGSNGKTTTKELMHQVMKASFNTLATEGNLNNHIGVPLTLLKLTPQHTHAIIEMGANKKGDIDELVTIAEPNMGIITNIGKAHLEGFGGETGVEKGKTEMFYYLFRTRGKVLASVHEEKVIKHTGKLDVTYYGCNSLPKFVSGDFHDARMMHDTPDIAFELEGKTYTSALGGSYNFKNILTAIAVGKYFGIDTDIIGRQIAAYIPSNMRYQWLEKDGNRYLLDAYNANPDSMSEAIHNFDRVQATGKIVILGDMFELGDSAAAEHQKTAWLAQDMDFESVLLCGNAFSAVQVTKRHVKQFDSYEKLENYFRTATGSGKTILIKGSRGMKLERLLQ